MFRDSENLPSFFPEEDDHIANDTLLKQVTNLDIGDLLNNKKGLAIKHSLGQCNETYPPHHHHRRRDTKPPRKKP